MSGGRQYLLGAGTESTPRYCERDPIVNPEPWTVQNRSLIPSETIRKPETQNRYQSADSGADATPDRVLIHLPACPFVHLRWLGRMNGPSSTEVDV
ncbi:hypothetical protein EYF80_046278 [Liparis tanakae]|uniref:Uncharacterized protein n=1 Tax=Liparis tanakae TaxID=230148 RepID=A0A4Z2FS33_9TELE|nr:hypothetical protein EYF80_046278 [Liparis tanakae]